MECVSPFWAKVFPGHAGDISKDGPGGERGKDAPSSVEGKRSPMTLNLAKNRFFVINNGRVEDDNHSLGGASVAAAASKSCVVSVTFYEQCHAL